MPPIIFAPMPLQLATDQKHAARVPPPDPVTVNVYSFFSLALTSPMRNGKRPKNQRWGAGDAHPVAGATLELYDENLAAVPEFPIRNPKRTVNSIGQRNIDIGFLPDGAYVLLLVQPPGHELRARSNPTGLATGSARDQEIRRPVGARDSFLGDPPGHRRFRQLEVTLTMMGGELTAATLSAHMLFTLPGGGDVSHGAVLLEDRDLWIDWRPDFVQIQSKKMKAPPRTKAGRKLRIGEFIHLHQTEGRSPGSAIDQFLRPPSPSEGPRGAHYVVDVNGFVVKLCDEAVHAQHSGRAHWYDLDSSEEHATIPAFGDISVGIEQVHDGTAAFPKDQLLATSLLVAEIRSALVTSKFNVLGDGETALKHDNDLSRKALGRKRDCPGFLYDWTILERAGNATQPQSGATVPHAHYDDFFLRNPKGELKDGSAAAINGLKTTLARLGYFVFAGLSPVYDEATERAVEAFQGRYFSGPARVGELATVQTQQGGALRPLANLVCVTRMHEVLDARGTFSY